MSNHNCSMIAYVAIQRHRGGGATFAYLPNLNVNLPSGWQWSRVTDDLGKRVIDSVDVTDVGHGMTLDQTCRMMSAHTGITWPTPEVDHD